MATLKTTPCKKCKRPIKFVEMEAGSIMPVDARPQQFIMLTLEGKGKLYSLYAPHWGTCEFADEFRKESKKE